MDISGRKMRRPPACVQCRRRKIGCDRVRPVCGNCAKNPLKGDCIYPDVPGQIDYSQFKSNKASSNTNTITSVVTPTVTKTYTPVFNPTLGNNNAVMGTFTTPTMPNQTRNSHNNYNAPSNNNAYVVQQLHTKIPSAFKDQNNGIASMKQIKLYNTRMQLMNNQQQNAHFGEKLLWLNDNTSYDLLTSKHSQDEVLDQEMKFLVNRLYELQQYANLMESQLSESDESDSENEETKLSNGVPGSNNINSLNDKNRSKSKKRTAEQTIIQKSNNQISKKPKPAYLDQNLDFESKKLFFNVLNQRLKDSSNLNVQNSSFPIMTQVTDQPNTLFDWEVLAVRDWNLFQFCNIVTNVLKNNFNDILNQWKLSLDTSGSSSSSLRNDYSIRFPSKDQTKDIIIKNWEFLKLLPELFPFMKKDEIIHSIQNIFNKDGIFSPNKLSLLQLSLLGQISIILLIIFECLYSSDEKTWDDDLREQFQILQFNIISLRTNTLLIILELERRDDNIYSVEEIKFTALLKYYKSIATIVSLNTSSSEPLQTTDATSEFKLNQSKQRVNPPSGFDSVDQDEDMHKAIFWGYNSSKDLDCQEKTIWNFIYKNYCERHLAIGEIPALVSEKQLLKETTIPDSVLRNTFNVIASQIELIKLLHTKSEPISIRKIKRFAEDYKKKLSELQSRENKTDIILLQNMKESFIYCHSISYLNYFAFLHWEQVKDYSEYPASMTNIIDCIDETLNYSYTVLSSDKFKSYQIIYLNQLLQTLNIVSIILLCLFQRCHTIILSPISATLDSDYLIHLKNQSKLLTSLVQVMVLLLQNYNDLQQRQNPSVIKQINKMLIIFTYMTKSNKQEGISQQQVQFNNGLRHLQKSNLVDLNGKLRDICDSLKSADLYNDRNVVKVDYIETLGFSKTNLASMYDALY